MVLRDYSLLEKFTKVFHRRSVSDVVHLERYLVKSEGAIISNAQMIEGGREIGIQAQSFRGSSAWLDHEKPLRQ